MKKEINPIALVGIIVAAVIVLVVFGYKMLQPAPYTPSPGSPGAVGSAAIAGKPGASAAPPSSGASAYYPSAPAGSIPGKPINSGH